MDSNIHYKASDDLKLKIFPYLRDDSVSNAIRFDEAVIHYGNHLCRKYTSEHHAAQVRAHLRGFGKLILAAKEINPTIQNLSDLLEAKHVPLIIDAINKIAGISEESGLYNAPATATSLGKELKKLCKVLQIEFIKMNDKDGLKKIKNLMIVFEMELKVTVNKKGCETQKIIKRRKNIILPKTETIGQFREYLESKMQYYIQQLKKGFLKFDWMKLVEYTLVHLAVFNRKRPGETQRILIEDYKHFEIVTENEIEGDDYISKEQSKKWARVKFTGKLGNDNALLIHRELGFEAINLILKHREEAGVNKGNRYIFGEPSEYHYQQTFQACTLIRKISTESGIPNCELMRTRLLRQHLATEAASKNIDSRLENRVSDFMSHQRKVHDVHYVMTKKKEDITRISSLLEAFSSVDKSASGSSDAVRFREYVQIDQSAGNSGTLDKNCELSNVEQNLLSQAEIDFALGKTKMRRSWSREEVELVTSYFQPEILNNMTIDKAKVHKLYKYNKDILGKRTPHLITQFIKGKQKKHSNKVEGIKSQRERWSMKEKEVLDESIRQHLEADTTPTIPECTLIFETNEVLENRTPSSIKAFIYNCLKKAKSI